MALVEDGDSITIDATTRTISVDVSDTELQRRRDAWTAPPLEATRGTLHRYIKTVKSGLEGCVTDE